MPDRDKFYKDAAKSAKETQLQFFVSANGGPLMLVFRLVVGVLAPAWAATWPPHSPLIDFIFGMIVAANLMSFPLFHLGRVLNESMRVTDETLALLAEINEENLKLRDAIREAFGPPPTSTATSENDKAN